MEGTNSVRRLPQRADQRCFGLLVSSFYLFRRYFQRHFRSIVACPVNLPVVAAYSCIASLPHVPQDALDDVRCVEFCAEDAASHLTHSGGEHAVGPRWPGGGG